MEVSILQRKEIFLMLFNWGILLRIEQRCNIFFLSQVIIEDRWRTTIKYDLHEHKLLNLLYVDFFNMYFHFRADGGTSGGSGSGYESYDSDGELPNR